MQLKNFLISKGDPITPQMRGDMPLYFTNPFSYTPHHLVEQAAQTVMQYLNKADSYLRFLLNEDGKMFGVLVAESPSGELGFLAAYSGAHEELRETGYFVPPVYDLLSPDSFYMEEECKIIMLNDLIRDLENDRYLFIHIEVTEQLKQYHLEEIANLKKIYSEGKVKRDSRRVKIMAELELLRTSSDDVLPKIAELEKELQDIIRESQFQKAQIKRAENKMKKELAERDSIQAASYATIEKYKAQRKEMSGALQQRIFKEFSFLNAFGERKTLLDIFGDEIPPGGSGECAAPRLLEYAYLHGYKPVAMGEFWYGRDNNNHREGNFYPSCKGKCGPILNWMLQGLRLEPAEFHTQYGKEPVPEDFSSLVLYEDDYLTIINKPAGMLAAPGKDESLPFVSCGFNVHRLDMHTSGVLVLAKDEETLKFMQRLFEMRKVHKSYIAWLDGTVDQSSSGDCVVWTSDKGGKISIPLSADYNNRPMQMADFENGKRALTEFKVLQIKGGRTLVEFNPITGRTHQLRLHSAHPRGLNAPIVGDILYGKMERRLMLHASSITFEHPYTGAKVHVSAEPVVWQK